MAARLNSAEADSRRWSRDLLDWRVWLAVTWIAAFFAFFFSFALPNSGVERLEILKQVPLLLLENIDPTAGEEGAASSWAHLRHRGDLLLVAGLVLAGAWGLGNLLLRAVLLLPPFRRGGRGGHSGWPSDSESRVPVNRADQSHNPARGLPSLTPPSEGGEQDAFSWAERTVFAFGLGLSGLSLLMLGCGLAGWMSRGVFGGLLVACVVGELVIRLATCWSVVRCQSSVVKTSRGRSASTTDYGPRTTDNRVILTYGQMLHIVCLLVMVPFVMAMFLGAMLPPVDFDVKAYHLVGPKEWFQAGEITFLQHNVYTSFPFLSEMLVLVGMVLRDDWFRGALAGQAVLAAFGPLTALAVYAAGTRWFGSTVGILAATIHLTVPWTYRISVIAYVEGALTFFLAAALLATMLAVGRLAVGDRRVGRLALLAGLLAGSAMAAKYPGLLQVVIPLGVALLAAAFLHTPGDERRRIAIVVACLFACGTALTIGPWLVKNIVQTGNPVYPLAYGIFGGRDLDPELAEKWRAGHSPGDHRLDDLGTTFVDVTAKSDWLSPLLFGLAPLALVGQRGRRMAGWLWLYAGFLFLSWWVFTHRIDRFWIPLIPIVSLLAGMGAVWRANRIWYCICGLAFAVAMPFNLAFITTPWVGYNAYLADLDEAREGAESTAAGITFLNEHLPRGSKVLGVGEAQVFDARFPVVYNSVFDHSIFEQWFAEPTSDAPHGERPLRDAAEIRQTLAAAGITHIYVNWQEILRYRTTYGYTDFITPQRFARLQELGILGAALTHAGASWESVSEPARNEVERWAPELKTRVNGEPALITFQVYPVRR